MMKLSFWTEKPRHSWINEVGDGEEAGKLLHLEFIRIHVKFRFSTHALK